jgi:hypothetical protein
VKRKLSLGSVHAAPNSEEGSFVSHQTKVVTFNLTSAEPRAWLVLTSDTTDSIVLEMGQRPHQQQSVESVWSASPALVPGHYRCRFYCGDERRVFYHGPAHAEGSVDCGMDAMVRVTAKDGSRIAQLAN